MKINDRFEIQQDPRNARCWIVQEHRPKSPPRSRYYATLEQACLAAFEMADVVGEGKGPDQVVEAIHEAKKEVIHAVRSSVCKRVPQHLNQEP